jgi:CRP/FNR family cyclic AMP-dependent transcriptional regulator
MRKGLIILGDLLDQDLIWLSRNGAMRALSKGERLIQEGERVQDLFMITDGWFDVTVQNAPVARVGVGDILGEMSFVEKQGASATVTASEPARVLAVPQQALLAQFRVDEGFAARFYRALAVFLSDRLRSMAPGEVGDELDEGVLDSLHVAGDRMLRLITLLEGNAGPR